MLAHLASREKMEISIIERAFQLAAAGEFRNIAELNGRLKKEGYNARDVDAHLRGPAIRQSLSKLFKASAKDRPRL